MNDTVPHLKPEAESFYKTLPPDDYPRTLIATYPRIANQIVALMGDKASLAKYFEGLLADQRGSRQGFDFSILVEIQNLFDHMVGIPGGFSNTNSLLHSLLKK